MRLVVTRPEPEAGTMAETLRAAGHDVIIEPLLVIEPMSDVDLSLVGVDALVVTSAHALMAIAGHAQLAALRSLSLYAVGGASAKAARRLGFAEVIEGGGSAATLVSLLTSALPRGARALHLAGDVVAVDLATPLSQAGITLGTAIVYQASARGSFSEKLLAALRRRQVDGVILMSPRTARTFATLMVDARLDAEARDLVCFCLSPGCAAALTGLALRGIRIAARPDLSSLLALIDRETSQLPEAS
jgi:uroporphyrinogen-III synthase